MHLSRSRTWCGEVAGAGSSKGPAASQNKIGESLVNRANSLLKTGLRRFRGPSEPIHGALQTIQRRRFGEEFGPDPSFEKTTADWESEEGSLASVTLATKWPR